MSVAEIRTLKRTLQRGLIPQLSAARREEGLEECGGVISKDAEEDFDAVVEARVGEDFETGADGATFGVIGAVDEARNAGLNHGAGAHGAGFESHVQRGTGQAIVGENASAFAKHDDFGVSSRIVIANGAVARAGDDFVFVDEDSADGDFAGLRGGASFGKCELHVIEVRRHLNSSEE